MPTNIKSDTSDISSIADKSDLDQLDTSIHEETAPQVQDTISNDVSTNLDPQSRPLSPENHVRSRDQFAPYSESGQATPSSDLHRSDDSEYGHWVSRRENFTTPDNNNSHQEQLYYRRIQNLEDIHARSGAYQP